MKKVIFTIATVVVLAGCDSANQMIDKAQTAANQKVETLQNKLETVDVAGLNLELLNKAPELVNALSKSVNGAKNVDLSNPAALSELQTRIANAYHCLVEASSALTADALMNKLVENIANLDIKALIETSIKDIKPTEACATEAA
ncbi:hypothetical protein [Rheinheimera gaetbuli]